MVTSYENYPGLESGRTESFRLRPALHRPTYFRRRRRTMSDKIAVTDVKLKYATIQEAKTMPGLRLILGANAVPGPWREACKGIFHVKKIPYTPVASAGQDGFQRELVEWTAQNSAPV